MHSTLVRVAVLGAAFERDRQHSQAGHQQRPAGELVVRDAQIHGIGAAVVVVSPAQRTTP